MHLQLIASPEGQPNYLLAVLEFTHKGMYYKGSIIEEINYVGENTGDYLISLVSESGTHNLRMPIKEAPVDILIDEILNGKDTGKTKKTRTTDDLCNSIQKKPTVGNEFAFVSTDFYLFKELKALIREELTRIGR